MTSAAARCADPTTQQAIQRTHGARNCGLHRATSQRSGRRSHTGSSRLLTSARVTQSAFRASTCSPHARVLLLCVLTAQARGCTGVYKLGSRGKGQNLGSKGRSRRAPRTYQISRCSIPPERLPEDRRTSSWEQRGLEPKPRPSLPSGVVLSHRLRLIWSTKGLQKWWGLQEKVSFGPGPSGPLYVPDSRYPYKFPDTRNSTP